MFSLKHLVLFSKLTSLSPSVTLLLANDMPIILVYEVPPLLMPLLPAREGNKVGVLQKLVCKAVAAVAIKPYEGWVPARIALGVNRRAAGPPAGSGGQGNGSGGAMAVVLRPPAGKGTSGWLLPVHGENEG